MARFVAGFMLATLLWGGTFFAWQEGLLDPLLGEEPPPPELATAPALPEEAPEENTMRRRRRRRGRRGMRRGMRTADSAMRAYDESPATVGEDLGEDDPRSLDLAGMGGEQQLSSSQIESAIDGSYGQLRRCFVLADPDAPLRGRLTLGLRIGGNGRVNRVQLNGPGGLTRSEAGTCLRQAARRIRFPSFDGPDMFVRYPITLE